MNSSPRARGILSNTGASRAALILFAILSVLTSSASEVDAQARYILQDLGTFPTTLEHSLGSGITDSGQVVGTSNAGTGSHAFLTGTDGQSLNDLGVLMGALDYSEGRAVSPDGQVAGISKLSTGNMHAFWRSASGGPLVDLGTLPGHNSSFANGVNSSGKVVGYSFFNGNPNFRAFVSAPSGGALTDIGTLGGDLAIANAINSAGRIAGQSDVGPGGPRHAFLTDSVGGNMKDLGTLPFGSTTVGFGVNDAGQVVGYGNVSGGFNHAFVSDVDGGALTDIGFLPGGQEDSVARAINNFSVVVGQGSTISDGLHAFIYSSSNGMEDLNNLIDLSSGFILWDATDINNRGQISGSGRYSQSGPSHAFLLTPGIPDSNRLGLTFSGGSATAGSGGSFTFQALNSIKITHLAVMDSASDGLASSMSVTLTGPGNQLLASVSIPAGSAAFLVNGSRYVALPTPLLIPAGPDLYTITSSGSEPVVANATTMMPGPDISTTGGTLGPNFLYTRQPVSNPDFEYGPFMSVGTVAEWAVTGDVASIEEGATSAFHGAAFSAGSDSQGNTLTQQFFTTPNLHYTLAFDSGVFGQINNDFLQLHAQISGNGNVLDQTVTPPYAATFDPAMVMFQHYQFDFVANTATSALAFTDIGLGNASADVILDKVLIAAAPPSYSAWQTAYFSDDQQNDLTVSGPAADPDSDGLTNGFEFYFNFNPVTGMSATERAALPQLSFVPNNATLAYRRRIGSGGVIGFSTNLLQAWDERDGIQPAGTAVATGDNVTETFSITIPATSPQFYRLTLSLAHPPSATQWKVSAGGNNHWYEVVKVPVRTWRQARDYAVDRGGYLATITSSAENDFVQSLTGSSISPFLGGYRDNSNVWHWVTGESFTYTNWDTGEPNNSGGVEDCLQLSGASGTWNDVSKDNTNSIVIEYPN